MRVLVVEDFELLRDSIVQGLTEAGFAVDAAGDGEQGLWHATNCEYALLELLAMRTGQVVTRTDIWEHVYSFNSAAESNVVDVFIAHLRRKLEAPGQARLIHTRRGQGYVLEESSV